MQVGDAQGVFSDFIVTVEHDTFDRFGFGAVTAGVGLTIRR